jgi:hypothetical protein
LSWPPEELELVVRTRPRLTAYVRRRPITRRRPTPAQAEARLKFSEARAVAKLLSAEEVARLAGGAAFYRDGKPRIRTPDGRVLQKDMAAVRALMRGWRSGKARAYWLPAWLLEPLRRLSLPLGRAEAEEELRLALEAVRKLYFPARRG